MSLKNETRDLLEYGSWMNVLWVCGKLGECECRKNSAINEISFLFFFPLLQDIDADTYTLLRDPSAIKAAEESTALNSGVVS